MDAQALTQLRILERQATSLLRTVAVLAPTFRFEDVGDPTLSETKTLVAQVRELLRDSTYIGTIPDFQPRRYSTGVEFAYAQDIRAILGSVTEALAVITEKIGEEFDDLPTKISSLEVRLADAESRSIAIKDDELRERTLDLLLRPNKADTAVREAAVVLEDRIRRVAGLADDKYGVGLVDAALSPKTGILQFPGSTTEHEGFHQVVRGTIGFFKNPTSHRIIQNYEITRARQVVGLVDTLLQLLQEVQPRGGRGGIASGL